MTTDTFDSAQPKWNQAVDDLLQGAERWPLWGRLGWNDILQRYRRSFIGPLWITISMAVLIAALGFLYSFLFKMELSDYLPFLAAGFIFWGLLSGIILESCTVFIDAEGVIKQTPGPVSVYVYRLVWRNLLFFVHNALVFVVVAVVFDVPVGSTSILAVLGLVLVIANGLWIAIVLGMFCARFRDANPLIASLVQLCFFVTPIIWKPEMLPDRAFFLVLNPFFHFIELVRAPLLGAAPDPLSWWVAGGLAIGGWLVMLPLLGYCRSRLVYWL